MKSYYESWQDEAAIVNFRQGRNFYFPPHFHKKAEILILTSGSYNVSRNGKNFTLTGGDIAFFDSYDIHAYDRALCDDADGLVLIIPVHAAEKFFARKNGKKVLNTVIRNKNLCERAYALGKAFVTDANQPESVRSAAAELILSLIEPHLEYYDRKESDETAFMQNLLIYLNDNFKENISLTYLAKKFGYTPEHVSRVFHRYLGTGLPDYLNGLRLDYIDRTLKTDGKVKITALLFDAGFKSVQTYYRAKAKKDNLR